MSFFTTIQNSQAYLQSALNSASSQDDLETQSMEAEQSLQNEDNIAAQALKSAGMSDLFLGAPVALRGLIEAPAVYGRAKEAYAGLKDTYYKIKSKAEELHNLVTTAPEKLKALREANAGEGLSPEDLQAKVVELFGEKIGNSAVGKSIVENLGKFKEAHGQLKQAALEHFEAGKGLLAKAEEHVANVKSMVERPLESLSSSDLADAFRSSDIVNQIHGAVTEGAKQFTSALPSTEELSSRLEAIKSKVAPAIEAVTSEIPKSFEGLNKKIPYTFEELAKSGKKAIASRLPEMTPLEGLRTAGETTLKRTVLEPFMEKVSSLKTSVTDRIKALKSQQEEITSKLLTGDVPEELKSQLEAQLTSIKGKILGEQGNISTSNRLASLSEAEPKMVSAAKGEVDLVEPKIASARNKAFERIAPKPESSFETLAKKGLSDSETGLSSYYAKAKNYLSTLKESSPGKILGGTLGAGLEGVNVAAGVESARQIAEGHLSAMNVLQTSQLKNAPEALKGAVSTIGEGIKATGQRGVNFVEGATNTLKEYADKARSTVSDTMDLLKSHVAESGAEDVAKGIAEKGLGSFLGEAVLGSIPVVGEIGDAILGIGSVVEAIKDIGHKAPVAPAAPSIVEGTQVSRQAGIY
jgi:hypothetical protein